jgi:hypothetical protein
MKKPPGERKRNDQEVEHETGKPAPKASRHSLCSPSRNSRAWCRGAPDWHSPCLGQWGKPQLQAVKPPISIHGRRALAGPEGSPWTIPWEVVHRRIPLVDRPHVCLMPNTTRLRNLGMEDGDRGVLGVVVKFHPDLPTVRWQDNLVIMLTGRSASHGLPVSISFSFPQPDPAPPSSAS